MTKKLITREQIKDYIKSKGIHDAKVIGDTLKDLFGDILQEALEAEMDDHLGYEKYDLKNKQEANSRNGHTKKTVRSEQGEFTLKIPRDVSRDFEPKLVKKNELSVSLL